MTEINIVACIGKNWGIGMNGKMPWSKQKADMHSFKLRTIGSPVIMGRKTFESLGSPLKNRTNIVIQKSEVKESIHSYNVCKSVEKAVEFAETSIMAGVAKSPIMVIGGAQIYKEFLLLCSRIWLTVLDFEPEADTFFPNFDFWNFIIENETSFYEADENNEHRYKFLMLRRK